jgi:hypothetical protein
MLSIQKMHRWIFEERNDLSFIFVDYQEQGADLQILNESAPIPIEQISWDCLSIEAQGYGVIQKVRPLKIIPTQTKREFYIGFLAAYAKYLQKENKKHEQFAKRLIRDTNTIDW